MPDTHRFSRLCLSHPRGRDSLAQVERGRPPARRGQEDSLCHPPLLHARGRGSTCVRLGRKGKPSKGAQCAMARRSPFWGALLLQPPLSGRLLGVGRWLESERQCGLREAGGSVLAPRRRRRLLVGAPRRRRQAGSTRPRFLRPRPWPPPLA